MAIVVASALTLPSVALAAPGTGSRIDPAPGSVNSVDTRSRGEAIRALNQFARCFARQRRKGAEAVLALPYLSDEQMQLVGQLVGGTEDCWAATAADLRLSPRSMPGGMAEQLVLDRLPPAQPLRLTSPAEAQIAAAGLAPRNVMEDFAQCVVMKDPATAYALIATQPTSAEEGRIIQRLAPNLGPCVLQGQQLELNRPTIRAVVAVGLHRLLGVLAPPVR